MILKSSSSRSLVFDTIHTKLTMKIFDEYVSMLRDIYCIRFSERVSRLETSREVQSTPNDVTPLLIITLESCCPDRFRKHRKGNKEVKDI
jgi:hypothetical protein